MNNSLVTEPKGSTRLNTRPITGHGPDKVKLISYSHHLFP